MSTLDDYTVEIDETDPRRVVLIVRILRLIVLGQTLAEARALATAAITFRSPGTARPGVPTRSREGDQGWDSKTPHGDTAQAA
jgi:hypothetical protein